MTKQEELCALKEQRKNIDRRIKELTTFEIVSDRCKFYKKHYSGVRNDEWLVTYRSRIFAFPNEDKNRTLIASPNREDAINEIDNVIEDLRALKKTIEETEYAE